MSLHMAPKAARLTVLGHGWNNDLSIISGEGLTFDGELWKDTALYLDYSVPDGVEWDTIADTKFDIDHKLIIYTDYDDTWEDPFTGIKYPDGGIPIYFDPDGNYYTDPDLDGIFTDPNTGSIYDGIGNLEYVVPDLPYHYDDTTGLPYLDNGDGIYIDPITGSEWTGTSDLIDPDVSGIYTDPLGDDIWKDPVTDKDFNGIGDMWIPESEILGLSEDLSDTASSDSSLSRYAIPDDVIPSLYGGPVTVESEILYPGPERPHTYTPGTYYIQKNSGSAEMFLGEPFYHGTATGGSITVYDEAITIRDGSTKAVYHSDCSTRFSTSYLPSPYSSYPIAYVCWQCVHGSFSNYLLTKTQDTISTDDIREGKTGKDTMIVNGERYYRIKAEQVKDRI